MPSSKVDVLLRDFTSLVHTDQFSTALRRLLEPKHNPPIAWVYVGGKVPDSDPLPYNLRVRGEMATVYLNYHRFSIDIERLHDMSGASIATSFMVQIAEKVFDAVQFSGSDDPLVRAVAETWLDDIRPSQRAIAVIAMHTTHTDRDIVADTYRVSGSFSWARTVVEIPGRVQE